MFRTLTPIFSIVCALAVFFFFTQPIFSDISQLQEEVEEYKDAVENATKFNQRLTELVQQKNAFSARNLERLEAFVPDNINEVRMLVDLEEMIKSHNMLLVDIGVTPAIDDIDERPDNQRSVSLEEDFITSDVTFNLIGTYEQFKDLLRDVEKSLLLMEVMNIEFASDNSSDLLQFAMTVRLYSLIPS